MTAFLFPPYYDTAFKMAQPVLFAELAILLWLLIKGAKVKMPEDRGQMTEARVTA
jgi:hypothetical protein